MKAITSFPRWQPVCHRQDLVARSGVVALVGEHQIALVLVPDSEQGDTVFAIDNRDPRSGANVIGRGLVGCVQDEPVISSPLYKQQFRLRDGQCLQYPEQSLRIWPARINGDWVEIG
ncbi:MAG: nitrite reductase small subunit NirD [Corticimicrobacter sp.]|uniref:nitrite reductase small subunit NirD n=1 Tax=Corticimicrobacter sp. TaxID=2678536 RepID=UPI0032D9F401